MVAKTTNAQKCVKMYYKHSVPPKCLGHSCGHPQGRCITKEWYIEVLQKFVNQCTYVKYLSVKNAWFKP